MLRQIVLHGKLKTLCPDGFSVEAASAAEAVRALCAVTGGAFNPVPGVGRRRVSVAGCPTQQSLFEPLPDEMTEIHIFPAFAGGKQGGMLQIIVGVVLIIIAVILMFVPGAQPAAAWLTAYGISTFAIAMAGVMMVAGGVIAMMSPAPTMDTGSVNFSASADPQASRYLGAPQNTTKIGTRIPILYGKTRVYGQVLSINFQASDVAI